MKHSVSVRIISLFLCIVTVFSMSVTAFAADDAPYIPDDVSAADVLNELNIREPYDASMAAVGIGVLKALPYIIEGGTALLILKDCFDAFIAPLFADDETGKAPTYNEAVDKMQEVVGTTTATSTDVNHRYLTGWRYDVVSSTTDAYLTECASSYAFLSVYTPSASDARAIDVYCDFTVDTTGTYNLHSNWISYSGDAVYSGDAYLYSSADASFENKSLVSSSQMYGAFSSAPSTAGTLSKVSLVAGTYYRIIYRLPAPNSGKSYSLLGRPSLECIDSSITNPYYLDDGYMSSASRPGNYSFQWVYGDTYIDESTNEEVTDYYYTADAITFVDEGASVYYNPVTNTYFDMSSWFYDYSTKTYYITTDESQNYTITYGDEYVTINEGDTIYNYYYYADENVNPDIYEDMNSGGGSGDGGSDDGSGGILGALGDLLGSIAGGILDVVGSVIVKILDTLTSLVDAIVVRLKSLVDSVLSIFDLLPQMGGGFLDFLGAMFSFLPAELVTLIEFMFIAVAAVVIIKLLR